MNKSNESDPAVLGKMRVQGIVLKGRPPKRESMLDRAIQIAAEVHLGQTDKAGAPYILHPLRLMMKMTSENAMIAAVLHDVVEDSPTDDKWTFERMREEGFSEEIVAAIDGVTDRKSDGESYEDFVDRAGANPISREVKLADLEDNMNMLRICELRPKDLERLSKYHRSWNRLKGTGVPQAAKGGE